MSAPYPMPRPPRRRQLFFAPPTIEGRWPMGLRGAVAFGIPATVFVAAGHEREALLVFLGTFAVPYGERRPYRVRPWILLTAGVGLLAAVAVGGLAGHLATANVPVEILTMTVVACLGVYVVAAARLGPPGSFAFALVCGIAILAARAGTAPGVIVGCTAIGVLSSVIVSMAGVVRDRRGPERGAVAAAVDAVAVHERAVADGDRPAAAAARARAIEAVWNAWSSVYDAGTIDDPAGRDEIDRLFEAHRRLLGVAIPEPTSSTADLASEPVPLPRPSVEFRLRRCLSPSSQATQTATRVTVACLVAGFFSLAVGLDRPDWAIVSAVLVLHQGLDRVHGTIRGLHRFAGTVAGIGLFAVLTMLEPSGLVLVGILVVLQFLIELFIAGNYGVAVTFVTPVALLVGSVGHHGDAVLDMMRDRLVETVVGVAVAMSSMWLVMPKGHRRTFWWTCGRVVDAGRRLLAADASGSVPDVQRQRRDLQFELIGCTRAGADAAHNEPAWAGANWGARVDVARFGYELLAAHWRAPGVIVRDTESWERRADHAMDVVRRSRSIGIRDECS